jgi:hypothetical protein
MNIGIVVGIKTDAISEERFPEWLKDIDEKTFNMSKEKWGVGDYGLASDIGIAYYIKKFSNDNVKILTKKDISISKFNEFDFIIGLYDPYYYTNQTKDNLSYKKYNNIISNTTATFLQPLSLQKFVLNKKLYTNTLQSVGLPVMDTISVQIKDDMNVNNIILKIEKQCNKWDNDIFITKPQPGGFGIGFKKWDINNVLKNPKKFMNYIHKIEKQVRIEKPLLLIQKFASEFEKYYEIRTYWLNGKYSHSLGTIIDPSSLGVSGFEKVRFAYPESEYNLKEFKKHDELPDKLDDKLIRKLKVMGRKVIETIPKDKTCNPFLLRIDFGCCLDNSNLCRDYFINELEYVPNLFPEYSTHIDILKKVGDSIIKKINSFKN